MPKDAHIRFFAILFFHLLAYANLYSDNTSRAVRIENITEEIFFENRTIILEPETKKLIRNPLSGWAIYSDAYNPDMNFWDKFDNLKSDDQSFKISNYATHLYIRWPWSAFEKVEGEYAWEYDDFFKLLEKGAAERGLKIAFRVYVDSRDYQSSSTPNYVREAGAEGFIGNTKKWSPYPDDPVFQKKYEKFIKAFAARYNNNDKVEYIDGYGLGKWGEGHSVIYQNSKNKEKTFKWIIDLYASCFTKIPLALNYHRLLASEEDWGRADSQSEKLIEYAHKQGYILRHDAFGMGEYYGDFERDMVQKYFPKSPIIAESGWWHNETSSWRKDPNGYETWSDVWKQTLDDALAQNANTLDLRNISETRSWVETSFDLIEKFIAEGGYRLYPDSLSLPVKMKNNSIVSIAHRWNNLGVGVCPTNIKQWRGKYKTAFALLDKDTKAVKKIYIDEKADPSEWLKNKPITYQHTILVEKIQPGEYYWGLAIIDTTKNNEKGINIAAKGEFVSSGWLILSDVTVY